MAGAAMSKDWRVGEHLVVDEFVAFCRLYHAVERKHSAEFIVVEDYKVLVIGFCFVEDPVDSEA